MKRLSIRLGIALLLGACLGALFGVMFSQGMLQYWHKLRYFPYPVRELVFISGNNLWVETKEGNLYTLDIDCYSDECWEETNSIPSSSDEHVLANENSYYGFSITKECKFEYFTYSFFRKSRTCATTNYLWFEGSNWIYIILDEKGELWKWTGGFNTLSDFSYIFTPIYCGVVGLILGAIFALIPARINNFKK